MDLQTAEGISGSFCASKCKVHFHWQGRWRVTGGSCFWSVNTQHQICWNAKHTETEKVNFTAVTWGTEGRLQRTLMKFRGLPFKITCTELLFWANSRIHSEKGNMWEGKSLWFTKGTLEVYCTHVLFNIRIRSPYSMWLPIVRQYMTCMLSQKWIALTLHLEICSLKA